MARNFLSFPFAPYAGAYTSKAFNYSGGLAFKGLLVGINIQWALYRVGLQPLGNLNPNFAVQFNLNTAGPNSVSANWTVQSVYIDNEAVNFPVYVYFPDTQFAVSCPANSAGWYQVFTNARQALVCGLGITSLDVANAVQTNVFFTDALMVPSLDQEIAASLSYFIASQSIQRGGGVANQNYGPPALGDQLGGTLQVATPGAPNVALAQFGPFPGKFIYFTQIQVVATQLVSATGDQQICSATLFAPELGDIMTVTGASDITDAQNITAHNDMLADLHGNIRFSANSNFALRQNSTAGLSAALLTWFFVFTISPF